MKARLSDYVIVYLSQSNIVKCIEKITGIKVIKKNLYEDYNSLLKNNTYVIVLISAKNLTPLIENAILSIKFRFNHVPILLLLDDPELETARKCGELGVNRIIINGDEDKSILENIKFIIKNQVFIRLVDFNIDINNYPKVVQNALKVIEKNYVKLMGTNEIAGILDVSDCSLIREFNKSKILTPKRLLLFFKVKHSLILMMKDGLSLKEIANLSGFSNEKRFNECFQRIFSIPPGSVRENITLEFTNTFGKKDTNYEIS